MAVGDDDDIGLEADRIGEGTVPFQRPQAGAEEWIREDAHAAELDERRRVADEPDGDRGAASGIRLSPSA